MSNKETKQENKSWFVNSDGDITDGDALIAEPNYLTRDGHKNACLIAAAPELLAACESVVRVYMGQGDAGEVLADVVKAVNKARGV